MKRLLLAAAFLVVASVASRQHIQSLFAGSSTETGALPEIQAVLSPAGPGSAEPNLDVDPEGRVHLSWLEPTDEGHALRVARFAGNGWSAPATVRTGRDFFVNWADFPSVVSFGDGRLVAHWLQRTGSSTYAYAVRMSASRDGGVTWSAPFQPHTDSSATEHGFASLWRGRNAVVEAVWLDGRKYDKAGHDPSNEMSLATASFALDGRVSSREHILDGRVCDCCQTSAATTSRGVVIVYRDRSPDEIRDIAIVRREEMLPAKAGRWSEPKAVHHDGWKIAACPVNGPSVAARADDVAVAWFTAANDTPMVKVAFSRDAGATFSAPVRVDEGQPAGRVDVELTHDGAALVSWIERVGGETAAVRVRRVERNGRAQPPQTVAASSSARASGFPRMVVVGTQALFAWTEPGRPSQVRVARMKTP